MRVVRVPLHKWFQVSDSTVLGVDCVEVLPGTG
jgi:hypothetical protein